MALTLRKKGTVRSKSEASSGYRDSMKLNLLTAFTNMAVLELAMRDYRNIAKAYPQIVVDLHQIRTQCEAIDSIFGFGFKSFTARTYDGKAIKRGTTYEDLHQREEILLEAARKMSEASEPDRDEFSFIKVLYETAKDLDAEFDTLCDRNGGALKKSGSVAVPRKWAPAQFQFGKEFNWRNIGSEDNPEYQSDYGGDKFNFLLTQTESPDEETRFVLSDDGDEICGVDTPKEAEAIIVKIVQNKAWEGWKKIGPGEWKYRYMGRVYVARENKGGYTLVMPSQETFNFKTFQELNAAVEAHFDSPAPLAKTKPKAQRPKAGMEDGIPVDDTGHVPYMALLEHQSERSPRARKMDAARTAKVVLPKQLTPKQAKRWWKYPGKVDIAGVDTPNGVKPTVALKSLQNGVLRVPNRSVTVNGVTYTCDQAVYAQTRQIPGQVNLTTRGVGQDGRLYDIAFKFNKRDFDSKPAASLDWDRNVYDVVLVRRSRGQRWRGSATGSRAPGAGG